MPVETSEQRRSLQIALALNATMFVVGVTAGIIARSAGLIADGLDMLADAIAYTIALWAANKSGMFKANAARASGLVLAVLGVGVLIDVVRRLLSAETPEGWIMIGVATVAVAVNANVLRMLAKQRSQEVHFRATVIFTRVDVIANLAVIASGAIVLATGFRIVDLAVGAGIGLYVIKEAVEILRQADEAKRAG